MLPYFQFNTISIGPVAIQVWGLLVSVGIVAAIILAYKLAHKYLLSGVVVLDLAVWILVGGFIMARVFYVVFYEPEYFLAYPVDIFKIWQGGASSLGGLVGVGAAVWIFAKIKKFNWRELLPYFDIMSISLWLGWGIGRVGCFLIHDHPGRLSHFFLAVNFPAGARFDLGLLESLLAFLLFAVFYLLFKKLVRIHWGLVSLFSFASYAFFRFWLDFLRATDLPISDIRYFHLTPAQWGMMTILLILTFVVVRSRLMKQKNV